MHAAPAPAAAACLEGRDLRPASTRCLIRSGGSATLASPIAGDREVRRRLSGRNPDSSPSYTRARLPRLMIFARLKYRAASRSDVRRERIQRRPQIVHLDRHGITSASQTPRARKLWFSDGATGNFILRLLPPFVDEPGTDYSASATMRPLQRACSPSGPRGSPWPSQSAAIAPPRRLSPWIADAGPTPAEFRDAHAVSDPRLCSPAARRPSRQQHRPHRAVIAICSRAPQLGKICSEAGWCPLDKSRTIRRTIVRMRHSARRPRLVSFE